MGCVASIALATSAWDARAGTLRDELQILVESHPQIQANRKTVAGTEEQIRQAFAGYLPKVNLIGDAGWEYVNNPTRRVPGTEYDAYERGRETAGVVATQLLYDGGLTDANYDTAKLQKDRAVTELSSVSQNVLYEGITAYLNVLRQRDLIALSLQNEENIKTQLNLEDERVRRGSGIAVDVLQAKSRLQLAKERRVAVEGALKDAIARYQQVFGHKPDMSTMKLPEVPADAVPNSLEDVIDAALEANPALDSASIQTEIAAEQRDVVRSEYFPKFNLEVAGNYESDKNTVVGIRRDLTVLVKANWNLFNGFATEAGVARAAFEYAASKDNERYVRRKVEEQAKLAWQALDTARQRVALLENAVNIAAEVYEARKKLREAGKENVINVLDAENEVFNARINLTSAQYDARIAAYQVLLAMGQLSNLTVVDAASTQ